MADQNLIQKLSSASSMIKAVKKDGNNSFQNYRFQSEAAIKSAVKAAIESVGIMIIPDFEVTGQYDVKNNKGKNNHFVDVLGKFTITDGKETIVGKMPGSGQDTGEKAMAKAATSAQKYFYKQLFNISDQDEDPDGDNSDQDFQPELASESIKAELISEIKSLSLANGQDEKANLLRLMSAVKAGKWDGLTQQKAEAMKKQINKEVAKTMAEDAKETETAQ
ncbi:ERF family protein [Lentilactobacillus senioris]|uniref:ERF family protein n=1 Tax=Lentilactobacillus senioris TaxID=931534 RepID=UPI003D2A4F13